MKLHLHQDLKSIDQSCDPRNQISANKKTEILKDYQSSNCQGYFIPKGAEKW